MASVSSITASIATVCKLPTIALVEFYASGTLIGSDATAPYAFTWTNVSNGTYALTARAIDNNGIDTMSSPVGVTVGQSTVTGRVDDLQLDANSVYRLRGWACSTGRSSTAITALPI